MTLLISNFVETTLGLGVALGDLTITLATVPSTFPAVGAGATTLLVLEQGPRNVPTKQEVVLATARVGLVVTVTRGQDGTVAQAFDPGDRVCLRFVHAFYDELSARIADAQVDAATAAGDAASAQSDASQSITDAGTAQTTANNLSAVDFITTAANAQVPNARVFTAGLGTQFSGGALSLDSAATVGLGLIKPNIEFPIGFACRGVTDVLTAVSTTCYAFYMGRADKAYTTVNIAWRQVAAAFAPTYAEIGIATGAFTVGNDATLTQRGWTSISGAVTSANANFVTTVALSGISVLDDLWLIFGMQVSSTGTSRSGVDQSITGFMQSRASTQPQHVSGHTFTVVGNTNPLWAACTFG